MTLLKRLNWKKNLFYTFCQFFLLSMNYNLVRIINESIGSTYHIFKRLTPGFCVLAANFFSP